MGTSNKCLLSTAAKFNTAIVFTISQVSPFWQYFIANLTAVVESFCRHYFRQGTSIGKSHLPLKWLLGFALRIRTAHEFKSLARAHERVRVQNVRDFPRSKLYSETNAPFLLNDHGDSHFSFRNFKENNILNNWEKNSRINSTEGDITGPTVHVYIVF